MNIESYSLFLAASMALIMAPGPGILYVVYKALTASLKDGLKAAFGCFLGIFSHVLLVVIGVAGLLSQSQILFQGVKLFGAVYLVWIGFKALSSSASASESNPPKENRGGVIGSAFLVNTLNPKLAVFFLSYFPQFVSIDSVTKTEETLLLGTIFAVLTWIYFSLAAFGASYSKNFFSEGNKLQLVVSRCGGLVLIAMGIKLVVT